ncbi:outer membrane protein assembly factor BamB family protein [Yinghuangia soli]|uniref:PQQ-like beta-propeller repeat protein n=1 Tax=Yinghuangia soli TaxID=2908204 RepID=A0AA41U777_9ACTN|nr:PQQ-binding-like beta-propeller repeat protein [Yinghuangia soli]MCF2533777.1 PQQ-like beta-propeller repeat protein [Yinghuangia soli]
MPGTKPISRHTIRFAPWVRRIEGRHAQLCGTGDGLVAIATGGIGRWRVEVVDVPTGRTLWRREQCSHHEPLLAHGILYATGKGRLHALDARTGTELWTVPVDFLDKPVAADATVCVLRVGGAVAPGDGHVLWTRQPRERAAPPGPLATRVDREATVDADRGPEPDADADADPDAGPLLVVAGAHRVQAKDAATGELRWTAAVATELSKHSSSFALQPADRPVLLATRTAGAAETVIALDAATGQEQWRHDLPSDAGPAELLTGAGQVYITTRDSPVPSQAAASPAARRTAQRPRSVHALHTGTGRIAWVRPGAAVAAWGDAVYLEDDSAGHRLSAVHAADGTPRWTAPAAALPGYRVAAVVAGGVLCLLQRTDGYRSDTAELVALDAATGAGPPSPAGAAAAPVAPG